MPRQPQSEIAELFVKRLQQVGFDKEAYPNLQAYKDDSEPRAGSDSVSRIEMIYGVKPDQAETAEYESNIMEDAHPNSVIISPAYDKINALVENNIERNNIMRNIVNKPTTGNHTNPKYAHQELTLELVRLANEMDARNHTEIYGLADECLVDLNKQAGTWQNIKDWVGKHISPDIAEIGEGTAAGAGIGALIGAIVTSWSGSGMLIGTTAGAAAGAALSALLKTGPQVRDVATNAKELLEQMRDLESKVPEQQRFFTAVKQDIDDVIKSADTYSQLISELSQAALSKDPDVRISPGKAKDAATKLQQDLHNIEVAHQEFDHLAKSGAFAKAEPSSALAPIYWFIKDDIEDVKLAFVSLEEAIKRLRDGSQLAVDAAGSKVESPAKPADSAAKPDKLEGDYLLKHIEQFPPPSKR